MQNKLTEEQRKQPYAKFFEYLTDDYGIPEELRARIHPEHPMDSAKALKITEIDKALDPNYQGEDEGFCVFPDGSGYVGEKLFYPGVTKEMFEWWFAWHGLEDTRYRIWDPKAHYGVRVSRNSLKRRTNPKLNWKERNWNTCDFVMAYTVDGISTVKISFLSPEDFGFSPELLRKYDASAICAVSGKSDELHGTGPSTRILHETPEGLHVWCYFWYGYTIINRQPVRLQNYICDPGIPALQVTHCAEEFTRLGKILPVVYEENHSRIDHPEDFETMPF